MSANVSLPIPASVFPVKSPIKNHLLSKWDTQELGKMICFSLNVIKVFPVA